MGAEIYMGSWKNHVLGGKRGGGVGGGLAGLQPDVIEKSKKVLVEKGRIVKAVAI